MEGGVGRGFEIDVKISVVIVPIGSPYHECFIDVFYLAEVVFKLNTMENYNDGKQHFDDSKFVFLSCVVIFNIIIILI